MEYHLKKIKNREGKNYVLMFWLLLFYIIIPVIGFCRVLAELLQYGDGYITTEGFGPFCMTHMELLKPIFDVQTKLRNVAMGPAFWEAMSKRKIQLSRGHSVELGELMVQVSAVFTLTTAVCSYSNGCA